jgi:hypothetical protein
MLESVAANGHSFDECKEILKKSEWSAGRAHSRNVMCLHADIKLDSGFKLFYKWCKAHDIPIIIVSRCAGYHL